jgi:hypothetical protein
MRPFSLFNLIEIASTAFIIIAVATGPARAYSGNFDGGGRIADYFDEVASANAAGTAVEISGVCASACTMKLHVRHVCVYRDAELWFHAAHNSYGGINPLGTRILLAHYPSRIRGWVQSHGAVASSEFTRMSGAEAIELGIADCGRTHARAASRGLS